MKQEEKQLLLKDICARLPYHPHIWINEHLTNIELTPDSEVYQYVMFDYCKPYLRPMSSMTEEEKKELDNFVAASMFASQNKNPLFQLAVEALYGDFFNKHYIDYRGLIPMGLALEAPEGMYKF